MESVKKNIVNQLISPSLTKQVSSRDADVSKCYGLLAFLQAKIEQQFEEQFKAIEVIDPLKKIIDYSLFPAGKRIRPLLSLAVAIDLEPNNHLAQSGLWSVVLALELLHCASLIHDDLPAIDNDDMRRGKPACHKAFGEASSILAGDVMIPLALEIVQNSEFNNNEKLALLQTLTLAYKELCQGQQLDLLQQDNAKQISQMQALKTGAMFSAALSFTGIALGYTSEELLDFKKTGLMIGALFQIYDDYLDIQENVELKGRAVSSDRKNHKKTLATLSTKSELEDLIAASIRELNIELAKLANKYGKIEHGQPRVGQALSLTRELLKKFITPYYY